MGCYVHGLFAADGFRQRFLAPPARARALRPRLRERIEATLDALADHLEAAVDVDGPAGAGASSGV